MLDKLFDLDNPIMRFLSDLFDLMVLNLITLALCVPVVTAVPALTALHYMTLKMARNETTYIVRPYFHSFAQNFRQTLVIGLIYIAAAIVLLLDARLVFAGDSVIPQPMRIVFMALLVIVVLLFAWVIPLEAHFENTIAGTFRNSVLMSLGNFPRTLAMVVIWAIPVVLVLISYQLWPIVFLFGLAGPAYACARIYSPAFRRFEPAEEETVSDEAFEMDEADLDALASDLHATFGGEDAHRD